MPLPMVTLVRLVHSGNHKSALYISETIIELGMVTLVSPVHIQNAYRPIELTEFGMVIFSRPKQNAKALSPMEVTPPPKLMSVNP